MISSKRLVSTLHLDLRIQYRNGFYLVILVAMIVTMALLTQLPSDFVRIIFPLMLFTNVIMGTFLFMGALILYEQNQNIPDALNVSPINPQEYILGKVLTLTFLAAIEGTIVVLFTRYVLNVQINSWKLILGLTFLSLIYCLTGFSIAAKYSHFNTFMSKGLLIGISLSTSIVNIFVNNSFLKLVLFIIPTNPAFIIMSSSSDIFIVGNLINIFLNIVWIWIFYKLAIRSYQINFERRRLAK